MSMYICFILIFIFALDTYGIQNGSNLASCFADLSRYASDRSLWLNPSQSSHVLYLLLLEGCQTIVARTQQMNTFPKDMYSSGYFGPVTNATVERFSDMHNAGIEAANVMALFNWPKWKEQFDRYKKHCPKCVGISSNVLYPNCLTGNSVGGSDFVWISALKGKTVLIVTPWVHSTEDNYRNRALIWKDGAFRNSSEECLPTFGEN